MYYIPQVTKSGCGFTCLKMLLAIAFKDEKYLYLKEDENHGPYSYQELVNIAQRYEVTLIGVKYEDKSDLRHVNSFPIILTVNKDNESPHAVLLVARKRGKLKIQDPEKGVYWIKVEKFLKNWDGTVLAINHKEDHPFTHRVIDVKDPKSDVISYILQGFAALFLALATYFVKPSGAYFLPLLFCALSLICEIILRIFLLKRMQKCDKYLRRFLPYVDKKDYFKYYHRSQEYKQSALTLGLNTVFYLLVIILIATISLINSLTFAISVLMALLAAFIEVFFFIPLKKDLNKQLAEQEDELRKIKEQDEMEMQVRSMEVKSYRYAYLEFASKIIFGGFFLVASFFISMVEGTFAIPNIVFYTCVSFLIYQYMVPLFAMDYRINDVMVAKARINNLIHQNDENNSKRG